MKKLALALLVCLPVLAQNCKLVPNPITGELNCGGGGVGGNSSLPYSASVSGVTSYTILATTHGFGTTAVPVCLDNATPNNSVDCAWAKDSSTGDLSFTFSNPFSGTIQVSGTATQVSARRFKQDIRPLAEGLSWVMRMQPVTYEYKARPDTSVIGFIADDLSAIDRRFGIYQPDGQIRNFEDRAVIAALVKAVQEQQKEISRLQARLKNVHR